MNGTMPVDERVARVKARRMLTWLTMAAIVMFFAGLSSAYVVSMSGGYWTRITLPEPFVWSTVVILAGSITVHLALVSARRGRSQAVVLWLVLTLLCAAGFTWSQVKGWGVLVQRGITFSPNKMLRLTGTYGQDYLFIKDGKELVQVDGHFYASDDMGHTRQLDVELDEQGDRTGPYLYALTLLHLAHLAFGILALVIMLVMALRGRYTPEDNVGLWAGAVYWHFLGGLWVYLLLFLSLVH